MNQKQILKFIKKINYNVPIKVVYFTNKKKDSPVAEVCFSRFLNEDHSLNVLSFIRINKIWKKHLTLITLKAVLIHEVGHLYTGFKIKNKKIINLSATLREYYAQIWAIKRAKSLKMTKIRKRLITSFSEWKNFNGNTPQRIYKMAWKIAVKNRIIPR